MLAGKPILMGVEGDSSDLIADANCGLSFQPNNSDDLSNKIMSLYKMNKQDLKNIGLNGRKFYKRNLSIDIGVTRFSKIF